ncbi:hypothetical protein LEN26_017604 [Aphanomyces euteiches]|nr:hypothetical protein LEN26_017604 [Aphanomyces euteiches]KAH9106003.1 hypothetical protein AeMF1_018298 [Aphanomyces euteiches]KAH9196967.1 hypothetical protein AeNC1_001046 [Aphanomyces euteiches]
MELPTTPTHEHGFRRTESADATTLPSTKTSSKHEEALGTFRMTPKGSPAKDSTMTFDVKASPPTHFQRFKRWYVGDKDATGKRYCGSRLSRCPFICLHVFGGFLLLCLIIIPILTAVVVPNMIQSKFDEAIRQNPFGKAESRSSSTLPSTFEVLPDGSRGNFRFNLTLAPLMGIGGTAELVGPTVFYIADPDGKDWASVTLFDSISIPVSQTNTLSMVGNFSVFDTPSQKWIDSIFPTKTIPLAVHTRWTIKFWGFVWYHNLALNSRYDMPIATTLPEKFDQIIQNPFKASSSSSNESTTTFEYFSKSGPSNFRINTTVTNLTVLPGIVEVEGPIVFAVYDVKNKGWANVTFDSVSFPVYRTTRLSMYGNFSIYSLPSASVIADVVTTSQFVMVVKTWWTIKYFGFVWYKNLPLQSHFDLNSATGTQLWSIVKCKIYTC